MKNIKAIIFDLGNVILNIKYEKTIEGFKKLGIKNTSCFYSKKTQSDIFNQIEEGKITKEKFLLAIQKKTSNASIKEIKYAWNSMLLDLPIKRINLLKKLSNDYSIFLLSNTNTIHISELKKKIGSKRYNQLYNLFDKVYYSYEIGLRKPKSKAFNIILNENKLSPHEVFFIDDSPQHIRAARKLGIHTFHLEESQDLTTLFSDITL
tara:strand:+ start:823 stop:1443 length:621 start_codon:yes stop_codon:yes gene_type:complete